MDGDDCTAIRSVLPDEVFVVKMSAVICTRNRPDLIAGAVHSILSNDHPDFELIVIDQSTTEATEDALAGPISNSSRLNYVHTTKVGLSAAYNAAIAKSSGDLLGFTDDDCIAPPNWLTSIERAFAGAPDAGLIYGQVLLPKSLVGVPGIVPVLPIIAAERIAKPQPFKIFGMGANFAARRSLFEQIGGFDQVLGGGGPLRSSQDSDLQYRAYLAGLVTLVTPDVAVDHYGLRSDEEWPATLVAYGVGDGGFYMKHVRCGDLLATRRLAKIVGLGVARGIIKPLLGHKFTNSYIRGLATGMRGSFRFPIERRQRIYCDVEGSRPTAANQVTGAA